MQDPEALEALSKRLREEFLATEFPTYMQYLTNHIEANGGQFLCGSSVTIADLAVFPQLNYFARGIADHIPTDVLTQYPTVDAWMKRVAAVPEIAEYYAAAEAKA